MSDLIIREFVISCLITLLLLLFHFGGLIFILLFILPIETFYFPYCSHGHSYIKYFHILLFCQDYYEPFTQFCSLLLQVNIFLQEYNSFQMQNTYSSELMRTKSCMKKHDSFFCQIFDPLSSGPMSSMLQSVFNVVQPQINIPFYPLKNL